MTTVTLTRLFICVLVIFNPALFFGFFDFGCDTIILAGGGIAELAVTLTCGQ
jgi:hypothetical protein